MKRKLLPYLLTLFMSILGLNAYAHDIAVKNADGVTIYYFVGDSTASVTYIIDGDGDIFGYYGDYSGNVVIPESFEYGGKTYRVSGITRCAFRGCSDLISVTIPNGVTSIDEWTFEGCDNLTSITIPSSLTYIDGRAFDIHNKLNSVYIYQIFPLGAR